jgi:hypothetical protein
MRILLAFGFSPLPHAGRGFAGLPYDLDGPHALTAQQNDLGAPYALLWCVAIPDQRTQALAINREGYSCAGIRQTRMLTHKPHSNAIQEPPPSAELRYFSQYCGNEDVRNEYSL